MLLYRALARRRVAPRAACGSRRPALRCGVAARARPAMCFELSAGHDARTAAAPRRAIARCAGRVAARRASRSTAASASVAAAARPRGARRVAEPRSMNAMAPSSCMSSSASVARAAAESTVPARQCAEQLGGGTRRTRRASRRRATPRTRRGARRPPSGSSPLVRLREYARLRGKRAMRAVPRATRSQGTRPGISYGRAHRDGRAAARVRVPALRNLRDGVADDAEDERALRHEPPPLRARRQAHRQACRADISRRRNAPRGGAAARTIPRARGRVHGVARSRSSKMRGQPRGSPTHAAMTPPWLNVMCSIRAASRLLARGCDALPHRHRPRVPQARSGRAAPARLASLLERGERGESAARRRGHIETVSQISGTSYGERWSWQRTNYGEDAPSPPQRRPARSVGKVLWARSRPAGTSTLPRLLCASTRTPRRPPTVHEPPSLRVGEG